jgi:acetylornithine/N-succinyldiaminopimelate aminotransferase
MNLVLKSAVLAALFGATSAFSTSSQYHRSRDSASSCATQLHSSTIPSTTTTASTSSEEVEAAGYVTTHLTPPSKLDFSSTSTLFDTRVQKTYGRYPITFVSGNGATLTDETGKTYLDFVAGIATCALGHNNQALTDAVCHQMTQIHHVSNLYYTPQQGQLASWLCENSCADKAFFCNSGAEANEAAIKLARRHASNRGITVSRIVVGICPQYMPC